MKARDSADPKVDKDHDDPNKDAQGQDENQVVEDGLATVATLQEGQKEVVDHPQDEMGEVGDSRSEDPFHSEEQRQKRYQILTEGTQAAWRKADDIMIISKAEIHATEPPRTFTHDEKLYTNDNLMRIISEEKYDRGETGICEDWKVRQHGVPLLNKLRWAITEGRKIYEHAVKDYQDMMDRAEELIASVGEQYNATVIR